MAGSAHTKFFLLVGVLVAIVMTFIIYDRVTEYRDKRRLESLRVNAVRELGALLARERELEVRHAKGDVSRWYDMKDRVCQADPEWKATQHRLAEIEYGIREILHDHPAWAR